MEIEILDKLFERFSKFVEIHDKQPFSNFQLSQYIDKEENYKYSVYDEARENLGTKHWSSDDIGTGHIQEKINSAIKTRVNHRYQMIDNNLVDWRKKDEFGKRAVSKSLETTLFNVYKSKIKDSEAFEQLLAEKLSYQFIAYLFFIKDKQRFMPISQERFDKIFSKLLEISDFKTSGNASWENYETYNRIIKNVQIYLKTKDKNVTLLDAHTFLWIAGNYLMEEPRVITKSQSIEKEIELLPTILEEDEEMSFPEGKEAFRLHKSKERNKDLIKTVKMKRLEIDKRLYCQICGFSFVDKYGELGAGYIEAHHLFPVSQLTEETETKLEDIALVCSNCHCMLHRRRPWLTMEKLEEIIKRHE